MIDPILYAVYSYIGTYAIDVFLYLLVGYVFIRCRTIGYFYSGGLIVCLLVLGQVGGYAMPQAHIAGTIFMGTVAGGWRYLARARCYSGGFGFPFFRLSMPGFGVFGSFIDRFEGYRDKRRFRRTYAEELAREEAKKASRGGSSSRNQDSQEKKRPRTRQGARSNDSQRTWKNKDQAKPNTGQKTKQQQRKESFQRARPEPPPKPKSRNSLEILGLSAGYSQEELKERYRKLASQYHPDKYEHMSDTVKQEMNAEFVAVKQAYERLKK